MEPDAETLAALSFAIGTPLRLADLPRAASGLIEPQDQISMSASGSDWPDAPIISLVERLLVQAARQSVSDVHIEPMEHSLSIRFRIDGQLVEIERHPASLAPSISTRVKVMASLDIAESRLPQDGRLQFPYQGRAVDVRVATTPIAFGESIVLRLLGRTEVPLDLDRLGLGVDSVEVLKQALARPQARPGGRPCEGWRHQPLLGERDGNGGGCAHQPTGSRLMQTRSIDTELEMLAGMHRDALRYLWRKRLATDPPKVSAGLLRLALAYTMQEKRLAGLSSTALRQLGHYGAARHTGAKVIPLRTARPGMRLVRVWNDIAHVATVNEAGEIEWNGRTWRSLSEVARAITGTQWSGPQFFGLRTKKTIVA